VKRVFTPAWHDSADMVSIWAESRSLLLSDKVFSSYREGDQDQDRPCHHLRTGNADAENLPASTN
jgi:hypothetical protein